MWLNNSVGCTYAIQFDLTPALADRKQLVQVSQVFVINIETGKLDIKVSFIDVMQTRRKAAANIDKTNKHRIRRG